MVEREGVKSVIGLPLKKTSSGVVGVMFIHYRDPQERRKGVAVEPPGWRNPVWRRINGWRPGVYNPEGELLWRTERDWYEEGALLVVRLAQWEMEKMGVELLSREVCGEDWFVE